MKNIFLLIVALVNVIPSFAFIYDDYDSCRAKPKWGLGHACVKSGIGWVRVV